MYIPIIFIYVFTICILQVLLVKIILGKLCINIQLPSYRNHFIIMDFCTTKKEIVFYLLGIGPTYKFIILSDWSRTINCINVYFTALFFIINIYVISGAVKLYEPRYTTYIS